MGLARQGTGERSVMQVFTAYSVWVEFILDSAEVAASDGSAAIFSRTVFERLGD